MQTLTDAQDVVGPVSVTAAGPQVVDQATARRRALIADILAKLPADTQRAAAEALRRGRRGARQPVAVPATRG
jgi:hypothetical protein